MDEIAYYYRKHCHYRAKARRARFMLGDRQLAAAYGSSAAAAWVLMSLAIDELVDAGNKKAPLGEARKHRFSGRRLPQCAAQVKRPGGQGSADGSTAVMRATENPKLKQ